MESQKAWYLIGASKGLGLALVKKPFSAGQQVAATSRNLQQLIDAVDIKSDMFGMIKSVGLFPKLFKSMLPVSVFITFL